MAKNNLLKEAIADAKAVRETALANAKIALEEAFTPRIQSMLSAKLAEEEEMDMEDEMAPEMAAEMETPVEDEAPVAAEARMNDEDEDPTDMHSEEMAPEDDTVSEEEDVEPVSEEGRGDDMQEEDLELEAIIKELEEEMESETTDEPVATEGRCDKEVDEAEESDKDDTVAEADEKVADDNIDLDEIISALREEEGDDEKVTEEDDKEEKVTEELEEAYDVIKFLRSKINEVNLLNAKLLFSNKLFRNHSMNENQKMKVIENFDRAANLREVKLVFATLSESFNLNTSRTKRSIKESYASKSSASTAPSKKVISEGNDLAARWKKLANL
jgi:hypothetical protein